MTRRTEILIVLLIIIIFIGLLAAAVALSGERTIIKKYDSLGNRTGYSVIENGRESHFSKDWSTREGYSIHREDGARIDHYDRSWRRDGHSDVEREKETNNPFD